ncbi:HAD-like domain-containing protein [Phlebopus sp. FC_14]|nr:HAD-like domain-containing protein [Phlebopus sp. FC_14]
MPLHHIKAVIFDIGGVVLQSPFIAIDKYEREKGLPPNYLNVSLAFRGSTGAWPRFERGEIDLHVFYSTFSQDLSDVRNGNIWYEEYCIRKGLACPPLPASLDVDGRDLFGRMMRMASSYDAHILTAIQRLRAIGKWRVVALTNNFGAASWQNLSDSELQFLGWQDGPTPKHLRDLFDDFYDSSQVGLRKPDPEFYLHACRKSGFRPEEAIFLDDIKVNLKAAGQLGMVTIHVPIGGTLEVIRRLEEQLGIDLSSERDMEGTAKL